MTYLDPHLQSAEHIDSVRRSHFERSTSRPRSKLGRISPDDRKSSRKASGRLRTAAWRCSLDAKRRPESDVIGLALLSAVATWPKGSSFEPESVGIVATAFRDLVDRGYDRHEIELVFKRFRSKLGVLPDFDMSNENG